MPAANRHLPVVETRRLPHYIRFTAPRDYPSAHEPSAADRRLTSFYRADTARETQCWQWNQWFQGQTKLSQKYVSPPSEKVPVRAFYIPPFRSTRDGRQPSFTVHRLQRRKKLDSDGGLPLVFHYTGFCRFVKRIGVQFSKP